MNQEDLTVFLSVRVISLSHNCDSAPVAVAFTLQGKHGVFLKSFEVSLKNPTRITSEYSSDWLISDCPTNNQKLLNHYERLGVGHAEAVNRITAFLDELKDNYSKIVVLCNNPLKEISLLQNFICSVSQVYHTFSWWVCGHENCEIIAVDSMFKLSDLVYNKFTRVLEEMVSDSDKVINYSKNDDAVREAELTVDIVNDIKSRIGNMPAFERYFLVERVIKDDLKDHWIPLLPQEVIFCKGSCIYEAAVLGKVYLKIVYKE